LGVQGIDVRNEKLSDEVFFESRKNILGRWETGKEIDLEESFDYVKSLPRNKIMMFSLLDARGGGYCLTLPRGGVPLLEDMIYWHRTLEKEGDEHVILPVTIDSYTRAERFKEIDKALDASRREKRSVLNGFPTVNHGIKACRQLTESSSKPINALGGNPQPGLTVETSFSSGFTGFLGSGVCVPIAYSKHVSIEQGIKNYQYVDRLTSIYQQNDVPLYRETAGFLTGMLVPAGVKIALTIIDAVLMVEQGVRYLGIGYGPQLNILQDTAAVLVLKEVCEEYLKKFGYENIDLFQTLYSLTGAFPENIGMAYGTIAMVACTAGLTGVQGVNVKTVDEAKAVPVVGNSCLATKLTRQVLNIIGGNRYPHTPELDFEKELLKREVHMIIDKVLEMGDGDIAIGTVLAFKYGILDCPWSPNLCVKGKVVGARDYMGVVRYLDHGNMPIPQDIVQYHQEALRKRADHLKVPVNYELVMTDLLSIANGSKLTI